MLVSSQKKKVSLFKIMRTIIPMTFQASPLYFLTSYLVAILHGGSHVLIISVLHTFFDKIHWAIADNGTYSDLIPIILSLAFSLLFSHIVNGLHNVMSEDVANRAMGYINARLHEKSCKLNALVFEDSMKLDDIEKATEGITSSMFFFFTISSLSTFYLPYFIFLGIYLYNIRPILTISILIIFIPVSLSQLVRVKVFTGLSHKTASIKRKYEYYEKCIIDKKHYKETRLLGAFYYFYKLYTSCLIELNKKIWSAEKSTVIIESIMKCITLCGYIAVLFLLVNTFMSGDISIGAFAAVFTSLNRMLSIMEEIICIHIGRLSQSLGSIKNLISFLELDERSGNKVLLNKDASIILKDVKFLYPHSSRLAIDDINLDIKPEETIAIVGENGSGKTTLVKLIIGLYLPTHGSIKIGDCETSLIEPNSLFSKTTAVFQNFQRYKMNLQDNVSISDMKSYNDEYNTLKAIKKTGLEVKKSIFHDGLDTVLAKEFNGTELSGGEWQKIAIARGLYRIHNIVVLDEPTASIDPIEETKIFNKFIEISKGKTSIIVTHRLGSVRFADRIIVMKDGRIVGIGSHQELIHNNSTYSLMFNSQLKWYK